MTRHETTRRLPAALAAALCVFAFAGSALAQPQPPRAGYVYPAGGEQGTTFEVVVGGQFFDNVSAVRISGGGVEAKVLEHYKPINQGQAVKLRDQLQMLMKGSRDANSQKLIQEIRQKLATFAARSSTPTLVETLRLQVTVAPDAAPGQRDLRLVTPQGISNPRVFYVGQLPEFCRPSAARVPDGNNLFALRNNNQPKAAPPTPESNVALPVIVNGQIMPGAVDRFRFHAAKGTRLVVAACAREIIPYLPDAVPGWFQAAITLKDSSGKELAFADHFRFHPDPVLYCELPREGDYTLEVRDSIYRGREDFVYRVTIGEVPYITGIFPLGGRAGEAADVQLFGWNLPSSRVTQDTKGKAGIIPAFVRKGDLVSNAVPFALGDLPECTAKKPNGTLQTAQALTLPVIVNGRIEQAGEWDIYRFEGKAGDEIVAEVMARRLGSPMDAVLKLTDSTGKQLLFCDDANDRGAGLETHHADAYLRTKLPSAGTYYVHVADLQRQAGPEVAYRLRVSGPRPDFELRIAPSALTVRPGMSVPVTVAAIRKDGFSAPITLDVKDGPAGTTLSGATIPSGQDEVRMTIFVPFGTRNTLQQMKVEGRAKIAGADVVRQAVPAEDMMQAFAYRHLVPTAELDIDIAGRPGRGAIRIVTPTPLQIPRGGTARLVVGVPQSAGGTQSHFELSDPPEGITIKSVAAAPLGSEIVLECDADKIRPGLRGNLIVNLLMTFTPASGATSRPAAAVINMRRNLVGALPAIPFEVVGKGRPATPAVSAK